MLDELRKQEHLLKLQTAILNEAKRDADRACWRVEEEADKVQIIQNRIEKLKAELVLCQ